MEQLDAILVDRHVNLDVDEISDGLTINNQDRRQSERDCEKLTDSLIRNDVVAPNVVKFTQHYSPYKREGRLASLFCVVVLSILGMAHFNKIVKSFSHEATLDIETGMSSASSLTSFRVNNTTTTSNSSNATQGTDKEEPP